jgi:hypothetical protein
MYHKTLADGFFIFSVLAVFCAAAGWAVEDIWLASTQWLLVAIIFLLYAVYVRMSAAEDEKLLKLEMQNNKQPKKIKGKIRASR